MYKFYMKVNYMLYLCNSGHQYVVCMLYVYHTMHILNANHYHCAIENHYHYRIEIDYHS